MVCMLRVFANGSTARHRAIATWNVKSVRSRL